MTAWKEYYGDLLFEDEHYSHSRFLDLMAAGETFRMHFCQAGRRSQVFTVRIIVIAADNQSQSLIVVVETVGDLPEGINPGRRTLLWRDTGGTGTFYPPDEMFQGGGPKPTTTQPRRGSFL